ncbi:hypothetical protein [Pseudoalteromonas ruthenica]|uniref:hypothetical protein n=1 Tax=Pseudoalteromonas ruthenica TaxID=151081 RepID=UPI00034B0B8D|nr:hypothetical protein [Pseudoalteromonas ruthenica]
MGVIFPMIMSLPAYFFLCIFAFGLVDDIKLFAGLCLVGVLLSLSNIYFLSKANFKESWQELIRAFTDSTRLDALQEQVAKKENQHLRGYEWHKVEPVSSFTSLAPYADGYRSALSFKDKVVSLNILGLVMFFVAIVAAIIVPEEGVIPGYELTRSPTLEGGIFLLLLLFAAYKTFSPKNTFYLDEQGVYLSNEACLSKDTRIMDTSDIDSLQIIRYARRNQPLLIDYQLNVVARSGERINILETNSLSATSAYANKLANLFKSKVITLS